MTLTICDFCKAVIPKGELRCAVAFMEAGGYGVATTSLDVCGPCQEAKGLVRTSTTPEPNVGQLTPEELAELMAK